jgi:hypothetical protein
MFSKGSGQILRYPIQSNTNRYRTLGVDVVKFYVGVDYDEIHIRRSLLSKHSSIFKTAFELQDESEDIIQILREMFHLGVKIYLQDGGIYLPHPAFNVQSVSDVFDWLCNGTLPADSPFFDLYRIYKTASRFGMPALLNAIVDQFHYRYQYGKEHLKVSQISTIYDGRFW